MSIDANSNVKNFDDFFNLMLFIIFRFFHLRLNNFGLRRTATAIPKIATESIRIRSTVTIGKVAP